MTASYFLVGAPTTTIQEDFEIVKNLTKKQISELLTKTDIPQSWQIDKIIKYNNTKTLQSLQLLGS